MKAYAPYFTMNDCMNDCVACLNRKNEQENRVKYLSQLCQIQRTSLHNDFSQNVECLECYHESKISFFSKNATIYKPKPLMHLWGHHLVDQQKIGSRCDH